jgi:hypothetical protein
MVARILEEAYLHESKHYGIQQSSVDFKPCVVDPSWTDGRT